MYLTESFVSSGCSTLSASWAFAVIFGHPERSAMKSFRNRRTAKAELSVRLVQLERSMTERQRHLFSSATPSSVICVQPERLRVLRYSSLDRSNRVSSVSPKIPDRLTSLSRRQQLRLMPALSVRYLHSVRSRTRSLGKVLSIRVQSSVILHLESTTLRSVFIVPSDFTVPSMSLLQLTKLTLLSCGSCISFFVPSSVSLTH
mmetsp:Transcript_4363/g.13202  ORF Transcript_4363/g.13202 Transcript_4363/m.13202 type:complete len:202 (-) Transcript_4363:1057-1662(-)